MTILEMLLWAKILVSLVGVFIPFILAKPIKTKYMTSLTGDSPLFFRIYAVAILALLVNYGFALWELSQNVFPLGQIWVGIVSNLGASVLMWSNRFTSAGGRTLPLSSLFACGFFSVIALGLIMSLIKQDWILYVVF